MHAVDGLSDAVSATRRFLTPVQAGMWLRLAVVAFFVGGFSTGGSPLSGTGGSPTGDGPTADLGTETLPDALPILVAAGSALLLLWLLFAFVGSIMEFVLIESLRSGTVHVRRYARENAGRGIRLFGFRLVLGLGGLLIGGVPLAVAVLDIGSVDGALGITMLAALLGVGVYAMYAIVMRFTAEFVAPVMLLEDRGVVDAWRRFWATLKPNWTEYAVYLLLVWLIQAAVGIAVNVLLLIGGVIIAIPVIVPAAALVMLGDVGIVLAIPVILAGVLAFMLFIGLVRVPIVSYFTYYALLLLGDTDSDLDLIPGQRATIRTNGGAGSVRDGSTRLDDQTDLEQDDRDSRDETDDRGW